MGPFARTTLTSAADTRPTVLPHLTTIWLAEAGLKPLPFSVTSHIVFGTSSFHLCRDAGFKFPIDHLKLTILNLGRQCV